MGIMSAEQEYPDSLRSRWEQFFQQTPSSLSTPMELSEDQKQLYFELFHSSFIPLLEATMKLVEEKGRPIYGENNLGYAYHLAEKDPEGYFSASVHVLHYPPVVQVNRNNLGKPKGKMFIADAIHRVSLTLLQTGIVVVKNECMDNAEDSARVLVTARDLFQEIPSLTIRPLGNPASWINELVQRDVLQRMITDLRNVPNRLQRTG